MKLELFIENIINSQVVNQDDFAQVLSISEDIFFSEGTLLFLDSPITICGDVHGQLYDVFKLFDLGGKPNDTKYLFLGDYVDRGCNSVETFALLIAYKIKYPSTFYLLRGNHESRTATWYYGFYSEVISKFGSTKIWRMCADIFDLLPLAAVVDDKFFCVHGGLSPQIKLYDQIALIDRRREIPDNGDPMSDLCWSDPVSEKDGWSPSQRGVGFCFGDKQVSEFCNNNKIQTIVRAHQLVANGYEWLFDNKLVTVWSAPNYMYRHHNLASIMRVYENAPPKFEVFTASEASRSGELADVCPLYFL